MVNDTQEMIENLKEDNKSRCLCQLTLEEYERLMNDEKEDE